MMIIKLSRKLTEKYDALFRLAQEADEPICVTKDGENDFVLMSLEYYKSHFTAKADKETFPSDVAGADRQEETDADRQEETDMEHTELQLGKVLKLMYESAPRGRQTTMIHLFGVYYADIIKRERLGQKEIIRAAGLSEPYKVEINKGVNLSEYVTVNEDVAQRIREIEERANSL